MSVLMSLVPIFTFPIALAMGNERFELLRFGGLLFGLLGVILITVPEASSPDQTVLIFVPLALLAPLFYDIKGNVFAKWGTAGLSWVDVLYGASLLGAVVALPLAITSGEFINPFDHMSRRNWHMLPPL